MRIINISILFFLIVFFCENALAQKNKQKSRQNEREGDLYFYSDDYANARLFYADAWKYDSSSAKLALKLGVSMYNLKNFKLQSLPYFEKARSGKNPEIKFYLGNLYHLNGKFQEAIRMFTEYMNEKKKKITNTEINGLIEKSNTAIELMKHPVNVKIENMGPVINSEYPDYVPLISADESKLIFTSRRANSTGGRLDANGDFFEDIYISTKKNGEWTTPVSIGDNLNSPSHDACVGLSPDGELLFLYKPSKNLLTGDLYFSVFAGNEWMAPIKLNTPINLDDYTESSASLSADGNTLYFSSDRPGGFGKKDIYRVTKFSNGEWSKPLNLGPQINTPDDDDSPFIHPNRKTLYFSSKGHKNMGGYDIFKTEYNPESGTWTDAENVGYPINTPDDDIFFVLSTDGKRGYYSSNHSGGFGGSDIYIIKLLDEDLNLSICKGMVTSADSLKPMYATITVTDIETGKLQGIYNTNPYTGKFIMILTPEKKYSIFVEPYAGGYNSFSDTIVSFKSEEEVRVIKLNKLK